MTHVACQTPLKGYFLRLQEQRKRLKTKKLYIQVALFLSLKFSTNPGNIR
jgi:hypothetical protein